MLSLARVAPQRNIPPPEVKRSDLIGPNGRVLRRADTNWVAESNFKKARRCLKSKETEREVRKVVLATLLLGFYMGLAILVYGTLEPDWTSIDAAYFAMMSMSTVGYGDISPSNGSSRGFTLFMIFFGIVGVFTRVANAIGFLTNPITAKGRKWMEKAFPQIPVDLDGDGGVDYYKPRPAPIYYAKNLFPSLLLNLVLQGASAAVFCAIDSTWTFGDAIYHCLVTATTVGYGDVSNSTQAGRLWACFHIMLSVCLLGELISTFDDLGQKRKATLARVKQLGRELDADLLDSLLARAKAMRPLVIRDGKGLTELEFVLAMCVELGVVEWDSVQPFIKQFRTLDVNGDARLGHADLELVRGKSKEEIRQMALANPEVPMTVEARMGVTFRRNSNAGSAPSGSNVTSPRSAAGAVPGAAPPEGVVPGAVPEAAAPTQPKSASEVDLDGLNEDELHWLQKRIEQKLNGARNRVMASHDASPRP